MSLPGLSVSLTATAMFLSPTYGQAQDSSVFDPYVEQPAGSLRLARIPGPFWVQYSEGYAQRATTLGRGALALHAILVDSVGHVPAELHLLVLDEADWAATSKLPYGLHSLYGPPHLPRAGTGGHGHLL